MTKFPLKITKATPAVKAELLAQLSAEQARRIPVREPRDMPGCDDCGRKYGDEHGFPDLVLPDYVWKKISSRPEGNGILCPSCICKRANDAGFSGVEAVFRSGPFVTAICEPRVAFSPFDWALIFAATIGLVLLTWVRWS